MSDYWATVTAQATVAAAIVAGFAALATMASAIFIAFQAYWTRKSVKDTDATLKLGLEEFERGRRIFQESQKARIDAEMPRLAFTVHPGYNVTSPNANGAPEGIEADRVFSSTSQTQIAANVSVTVLNESSRQVELLLHVAKSGVLEETRTVFLPGDAKIFTLQAELSVVEWVAESEAWAAARHRGEWSEETPLMIARYKLAADFGADEIHTVVMAGSILQKASNPGEWEVAPGRQNYALMLLEEKPFVREYWESRRERKRIE